MTAGKRTVLAALLAAAAVAIMPAGARAGEVFDEATLSFAAQLDLTDWQLLPSLHEGRLEILDTLARRQVRAFYGAAAIDGASPTFSLLEIYFNAGAYLDRPMIRLRDDRLRRRLTPKLTPAAAQAGRVAPIDLLDARVEKLLTESGRASPEQFDAQRLGSLRSQIEAAARTDRQMHASVVRLLAQAEAFLVAYRLRVLPPAGGEGRYLAPEEAAAVAAGKLSCEGFTAAEAAELEAELVELARAWRERDARSVNELSAGLLRRLGRRGAGTYPPLGRRNLERLHNQLSGFTVAWVGYFAAAMMLLASGAIRRLGRALRRGGLVVSALSTGFLAGGLAVRWYISGRGWHLPPLTNQYESVLGTALMAGLAGFVLELIFRRGKLALAASVVAAVALLCAFLQLGPLVGDIAAPQAVLNTPILAWHVATLMVGYGVIAMSLLVSVAYLAVACFRPPGADPQKAGAAAGADLGSPPAGGDLLAELDRYNLVLLQLACWLVAVGVVLGAYWADRAWGRWWGWDAKETWGLMTLLVYVGIIHARGAVGRRSRGAWTAALAILGCAVMGFTWWGVNLLLAGLHGYA